MKSLELSESFWEDYTKAREFKEREYATGSQQSIEVKTSNFLKSILQSGANRELTDITEVLLEDMKDYGTLALPTMRRIIALEGESVDKTLKEFNEIIVDLGDITYLDQIKKKIKDVKKEVIIAIENQ